MTPQDLEKYYTAFIRSGSDLVYKFGELDIYEKDWFIKLDELLNKFGPDAVNDVYNDFLADKIFADDRQWHKKQEYLNNKDGCKKCGFHWDGNVYTLIKDAKDRYNSSDACGFSGGYLGVCVEWYYKQKNGTDNYLRSFVFFIGLAYYHVFTQQSKWVINYFNYYKYKTYLQGRLQWYSNSMDAIDLVSRTFDINAFNKLYQGFKEGKLFKDDREYHKGLGNDSTETFEFFLGMLGYHLNQQDNIPQNFLKFGQSINTEQAIDQFGVDTVTPSVLLPDSSGTSSASFVPSFISNNWVPLVAVGAAGYVLYNVAFKDNTQKNKRRRR